MNRPELDAPWANRLPNNGNASLSKQVFDIAVAQIESIVEPRGVGDDI
jgi:hypothetical protein